MYRVKSTDVWFNLPGVVAAYQPIAGPDPLAARQNVAHNGARFGVYTATPGVLPTWSAATGWTFINGAVSYLSTGWIPTGSQDNSFLIRYSGSNAGGYRSLGMILEGTSYWGLGGNYGGAFYCNNTFRIVAPELLAGILGIAGKQGYRNGLADGSALNTGSTAYTLDFDIGCRHRTTTRDEYFIGYVQSCILASRTLSPAEMWLASRQMAYCEQNPDWNAWARRRMYYYAPSSSAIRWPGVGRGGPVGGSPGIRGSSQ